MQLTEKAKNELREILTKEIGKDMAQSLSNEDLNKIGLLFLSILAEGLKLKVTVPELFVPKCK